jgi:signal peptidase I
MGRKKKRARENAELEHQKVAEQGAEGNTEEKEKKGNTQKERDFRLWAWGWIKSIALALVLWFVIQAFLIKSYRIDSGSMEPTLYENDFLFINKAVYGAKVPLARFRTPKFRDPRRGELIVLRGIELDSLTIVKRVIGIGGDTLEMRSDSLFRNGQHVNEPYAKHIDPMVEMPTMQRQIARQWQLPQLVNGPASNEYLPGLRNWGPFVVPDGHFFAMGDNRDASHDGRAWGFLPRNHVIGRPLFIYYSYDPDSWSPLKFITAIRWGRLLRSPG